MIAKYSRLTEARNIEDHYKDSVVYLERIPRAEPEALSTIFEFMGKRGLAAEMFVDNSIVDRMVREGFIDNLYKKR